jgi:hypothetical protein
MIIINNCHFKINNLATISTFTKSITFPSFTECHFSSRTPTFFTPPLSAPCCSPQLLSFNHPYTSSYLHITNNLQPHLPPFLSPLAASPDLIPLHFPKSSFTAFLQLPNITFMSLSLALTQSSNTASFSTLSSLPTCVRVCVCVTVFACAHTWLYAHVLHV